DEFDTTAEQDITHPYPPHDGACYLFYCIVENVNPVLDTRVFLNRGISIIEEALKCWIKPILAKCDDVFLWVRSSRLANYVPPFVFSSQTFADAFYVADNHLVCREHGDIIDVGKFGDGKTVLLQDGGKCEPSIIDNCDRDMLSRAAYVPIPVIDFGK